MHSRTCPATTWGTQPHPQAAPVTAPTIPPTASIQGRGVRVQRATGQAGVTAAALLTSCVPGHGSPMPFYERAGFVDTGHADEDGERYLRLPLR